ncbi:MAG: HPF/RaiA family ribosome-associated protein [Tistlia sp.]|uniref:cold shock domain-containing protein n=1 Tax=Tistlia sp. TaxID=3057121 RepID=UPI0034A59B72
MNRKERAGEFPGPDEPQQPLEVAFHGLESSEALKEVIEAEAAKLRRFGHAVTSARVSVERTQSHGASVLDEIHVDVQLRRGHVFAKATVERRAQEAHGVAFGHAVTRAMDKVVRQISAGLEKRSAKPMLETQEGKSTGRVTRLDRERRHGFLERAEGPDLFFHEAVLADGSFDALKEGDPVRFRVAEAEGAYGPQAATVEPLAPGR